MNEINSPKEQVESERCEECGDLTHSMMIVECGHNIYICHDCQEELAILKSFTCHMCHLTDYDLPFTD